MKINSAVSRFLVVLVCLGLGGGSVLADDLDKAIQLSKSNDPFTRCQAARALGETKDPRAIERLIQALKESDSNAQMCVIEVLGDVKDRNAVAPLIQSLKDQNNGVRMRSAIALGKLGDSAAVGPLIEALRDRDSGVRREAAHAVGKLHDARAVPVLNRMVNDSDAGVRREVKLALARLGEPSGQYPLPPAQSGGAVQPRRGLDVRIVERPLRITRAEELHKVATQPSGVNPAVPRPYGSNHIGVIQNREIYYQPPQGGTGGQTGPVPEPGQGCQVANPPQCSSGKKLVCDAMTCKCSCVTDQGTPAPVRYVVVKPSETTAAISFITYGITSSAQITLYGGRADTNTSQFSMSKQVQSSMDFLIQNLQPYTSYWFRISSGPTLYYSGSFVTLCKQGEPCNGPDTICTKYAGQECQNCYPCGGLNNSCCADANRPCDRPYGCQGEKCQSCPDQQMPVGGYCKPLPTAIDYHGRPLDGSDLGWIDAEEMQGLGTSPTRYYWMTRLRLYSVLRGSGTMYGSAAIGRVTGIPGPFAAMGYDHFGDGDFYNDRLYVPIKTDGLTPVVLVFDPDLNLVAWGTMTHGGGSWVAINPQDGKLYTSDPYGTLRAYDLGGLKPYSGNPASELSTAALGYMGSIVLQFVHAPLPTANWWNKVWDQGGAFSPNGILYYALDHASESSSPWTGIHAFRVIPFSRKASPSTNGVDGPPAKEINVMGDENAGFLHAAYEPCWEGWHDGTECKISRGDELEGVAAYRDINGTVSVLLTRLGNSIGEDDVVAYYWTVNEP